MVYLFILLFYRPAVWSGLDQGTGGQWVRPAAELTARGWAYNVFNITNTGAATYRSYDNTTGAFFIESQRL